MADLRLRYLCLEAGRLIIAGMKQSVSDRKFVVVLNKSYDLARLTSGIGHVTAGLVAGCADRVDDMEFLDYVSADDQTYKSISNWPFVVLRGRGGQLKTLRTGLLEKGLPAVAYLDTMLEGGTEVEMAATRARSADDLEILALATFGDREEISVMTKKFSLWT